MLSWGAGFWWHLSTSVAWGCCNKRISLILKQGLMKRKVFWFMFSDTKLLGVWLQRTLLPGVPTTAASQGWLPEAATAVHRAWYLLWFDVFCLNFMTLTLLCSPHSHSYLLDWLVYSCYFLGSTYLKWKSLGLPPSFPKLPHWEVSNLLIWL